MKGDIYYLKQNVIGKSEHKEDIENFISSDDYFEYFDRWVEELYELENNIGLIGVHNVNYIIDDAPDPKDIFVSGKYRTKDRPIFRPLQYVAWSLFDGRAGTHPRSFIFDTCGHIEGIVESIYNQIEENEWTHKTTGTIVRLLSERIDSFPYDNNDRVVKTLFKINNVYNNVKHNKTDSDRRGSESSSTGVDAHLYSFEEAMIVYFSCRLEGIELMNYMRSEDMGPETLDNVPKVGYKEYRKIVKYFER